MGIVHQGWFVRCDNCDQGDDGSIGMRTRADAVADARRAGWILRKKHWFCSEVCFKEWDENAVQAPVTP